MTPLFAIAIVLLAVLGCLAAALACQVWGRSSKLPVTAEWIEGLSIDRYRPMLRLLDEGDFEFLRSQPGSTACLIAKVRGKRCQLFREYLLSLEDDFKCICTAVKILMVQSDRDRSDLATALVSAQWTFACGMLLVRCRLALYRLGLTTVNVRDLIKLFDGMRVELRTLVPVSAASIA